MRFVHDNLYPLIAALIFVAATSIWFATSVPLPPYAPAPVAESWGLPKLAEQDSKKHIEIINARNLWGVILASDALKEPEWNVVGIARSGAERFILLVIEGKPVEMLKVGDVLPDGVKIVKIENDRFFVMTPDKKKLAFGLYKHDPAK
ncbi:MAG: hypothetical protein PHP70_03115 [Gallionella sp.]|nr:hypothetical protein [Gallionella sp.]